MRSVYDFCIGSEGVCSDSLLCVAVCYVSFDASLACMLSQAFLHLHCRVAYIELGGLTLLHRAGIAVHYMILKVFFRGPVVDK